jgi:hypothetical protein
MSAKTSQEINDLQQIALKLLATDAIANKINSTGIVFSAAQLSKVLPVLKPLGEMPLISLQKDKNGNDTYSIPTLYGDGNDFVVCLPNLNRTLTSLLKVKSWQIGDVSGCLLTAEGDIILKCAIACTKEFLDDVGSEFNGQLEGEGTDTLNPIWLKQKPQIELPLRTLPIGEAFEVISTGVRSRKYSTPMVNLKNSSGNEYHNVITNSALRNLIDSGCKEFMIKDIVELKKDKTRTEKVILTPLDGADFSNLLSA